MKVSLYKIWKFVFLASRSIGRIDKDIQNNFSKSCHECVRNSWIYIIKFVTILLRSEIFTPLPFSNPQLPPHNGLITDLGGQNLQRKLLVSSTRYCKQLVMKPRESNTYCYLLVVDTVGLVKKSCVTNCLFIVPCFLQIIHSFSLILPRYFLSVHDI